MTARKREGQFVWTTWLAKFMVGETTCAWAPWFRSNYEGWQRLHSDFDEAAWKTAHTRLLQGLVRERRVRGERVLVERQAAYRFRRPSGLVISGVPDAVAIGGGVGTVLDAKTGQPRASHAAQVRINMHFLRRTLPLAKELELGGEVIYEDGHVTKLAAESARGEFEDHLEFFLRLLESETPPPRSPSAFECRYCDIGPKDCPERWQDGVDDIASSSDGL